MAMSYLANAARRLKRRLRKNQNPAPPRTRQDYAPPIDDDFVNQVKNLPPGAPIPDEMAKAAWARKMKGDDSWHKAILDKLLEL